MTTPPITAERRAIVSDKVELPRIYMGWLTAPFYQPGDADADLLGTLLGGGKSSRLYKKLVYEQQIAQDVTAYQASSSLQSVFTIEATARPGVKVAALESAIDEELAKLRTEGPTAAELERARNGIETAIIRGLETLGGFGGVADRLNQYNHYLGNPDYLAADIGRYRQATTESVKALAQQLTPSSRVVVYGLPGKKVLNDVPRQPQPAQKESAADLVKDWRGQQPGIGPESPLRLPVPERFTLSNGLTVLLLAQHRLPVIAANLVTLRGSESNSATLPGLASFTADMLDEGTAARSALQLADDVAQIGATLQVGSDSDSSGVSVRALRKNAAAAFDLLADVTLQPAFAAAEVERVRKQRQTSLLQQNDNPTAIAARVFNRAVYGERHPYGFIELGTPDSLKAIKREDLEQFWRSGYTPANSALIVSGDLTAEDLRPLAEKAFGAWTGSASTVQMSAPPAAERRVIVVDVAAAPQTALRIGSVGVARSNPDYASLEVMNTALGGQFSSRINMNLREQHGYTYGARSGFDYRRGPGPFTVRTSVRGDATAPSVREVFTELERMRATPITDAELKSSKDAMARSLPGDFESTAQSVASIAQIFVYGLPLDYYSKLPASIDRVTSTDVQHVATQYLRPDRLTVVAVGDRRSITAPLAALKLGPVELRDVEGKPIPR